MVMQRWDPFSEVRRMQETMNRLLCGDEIAYGSEMEAWSIPLDVIQQGEEFVVRAPMPGVNPEEIDVSVEDNVLIIRGHAASQYEHKDGEFLMRECRSGNFHRSLRLPDTVDTNKAHPHFEHGMLTITIPKAESKRAKHLKVTATAGT